MEETVKLFQLVQKYSEIRFVKPGIESLTGEDIEPMGPQRRISKTNAHYQPDHVLVEYV